jgi:hypothetical protein
MIGFVMSGHPRLMMPSARKGRGRKRIERRPVPIPINLAIVLKQAGAGRPNEAPLLTKPSGDQWRSFDRRHPSARAVTSAGLDPAEFTIYALRHSSIVQQPLANTPTRSVRRVARSLLSRAQRAPRQNG